MRKTIILAALIMPFIVGQVNAQEWSFGFRAGLNYSKLVGPSEMDAAGNDLESFGFTNGFHIGGSVQYAFTDLFGVRADILFSQLGTRYKYNGDSYYWTARNTDDSRLLTGYRTVDKSDSQAGIQVPLLLYYRIGPVEISGGIDMTLIAASTGGGTLTFDGVSPGGKPVDPFDVTMTHNYNKDEARGAGPPNQQLNVDGTTILTPSLTGAYYDYDEKDGNWYKAFQFGLTAGLAFYLNEGLYIGGRVIYGLSDVDKNYYDISYKELNPDDTYIQRADKNTNLTIQATVGFMF